jgi:hypothetical protein
MTFEEMVTCADASLDAWNDGRESDWIASLHPDVEWSSGLIRALEGRTRLHRGHDGMREFWRDWHETWENFHILPDEHHAAGEDRLLYGGRVEARASLGGANFGYEVWFLSSFRDGLVGDTTSYRDRAEAFAAAGIEDPGAPSPKSAATRP